MEKWQSYLPVLAAHPLFQGIPEEELAATLQCMGATPLAKSAGDYLLRAGERTSSMGIVLRGSVLVIQEDFWGNRSIMGRSAQGDVFAESFAAVPGAVLNVSVVAEEDCLALMLNLERLLTACPTACPCHSVLIRNLVTVLSRKTMGINERLTHLSKRSTRSKLLSYLSAAALRQGALSFDIPFNRQQLADYLCVDRAAMCAELSKLQKEGVLTCRKNHFCLKQLEEL